MPGFEYFGAAERKSANEVLDSGVLMRYGFDPMRNGRWMAREMETALAERMQTRHAHLVSSGTAALTVALASAGVGAGDEVIVPTFTFVASFEAVLSVGAIPVLCDIDDTLTLDPKSVLKAITPRTRVIMPVHMCGSMADLGALSEIAAEHNLILLEDACQAIGGSYQGKPLGSIGDVGCFSFDYVKTITCGEGGGLITDSSSLYEKAQAYSDHGHDHIGSDRGAENHPHLGYNYRIGEINAAIGLVQLSRLDEFLQIQKKHYTHLRAGLEALSGLTFRKVPQGGVENYSFLNFFMPDEQGARLAAKDLKEAGFDGVFYWYDNNWHYHRKWGHLRNLKSLAPLPKDLVSQFEARYPDSFQASDHWMGRNLSVLIKLSWDEEELENRSRVLEKVISNILG